MPTTVKLKNSVTSTNVPSSLVQGEVAINVTDKKVWVGNAASGVVQIVGPGSTDLAVADGGTGASTAANARTNLSAAASGANSDITSLTGLTTPLSQAQGGTGTTTGYYALKNRIINGAMVIDQRNAGAASANTYSGYFLDRWQILQSTTGKLIAQQNAGSVTPPLGFNNYLGITSQSAYSVGAGDFYFIVQYIEGFNTADLGFGTANAKTITVSFQVYSNLTGTFGGCLRNSLNNRSYPFTYTVASANTWTPVSVTIAGDTAGTWVGATNEIGLQVIFGLGVGSTYSGTAGAWAGANYISATGATSVVGTNGATFYITGVQLEVGTQATSFEYRQYGTELNLCQRYFESYTFSTETVIAVGQCDGTSSAQTSFRFNQQMRTAPSVTLPTAGSGSGQMSFLIAGGTYPGTFGSFSALAISNVNFKLVQTGATGAFVAGNASWLYPNGTAVISASAEL
jgi:hypothetical protein